MTHFKPSTNDLQKICESPEAYEFVKMFLDENNVCNRYKERSITERKKSGLYACIDIINTARPRLLKKKYTASVLLEVFCDYLDIPKPARINRDSKSYAMDIAACRKSYKRIRSYSKGGTMGLR